MSELERVAYHGATAVWEAAAGDGSEAARHLGMLEPGEREQLREVLAGLLLQLAVLGAPASTANGEDDHVPAAGWHG